MVIIPKNCLSTMKFILIISRIILCQRPPLNINRHLLNLMISNYQIMTGWTSWRICVSSRRVKPNCSITNNLQIRTSSSTGILQCRTSRRTWAKTLSNLNSICQMQRRNVRSKDHSKGIRLWRDYRWFNSRRMEPQTKTQQYFKEHSEWTGSERMIESNQPTLD